MLDRVARAVRWGTISQRSKCAAKESELWFELPQEARLYFDSSRMLWRSMNSHGRRLLRLRDSIQRSLIGISLWIGSSSTIGDLMLQCRIRRPLFPQHIAQIRFPYSWASCGFQEREHSYRFIYSRKSDLRLADYARDLTAWVRRFSWRKSFSFLPSMLRPSRSVLTFLAGDTSEMAYSSIKPLSSVSTPPNECASALLVPTTNPAVPSVELRFSPYSPFYLWCSWRTLKELNDIQFSRK